MLKDGLVFIWELDMNLVFTPVDKTKSGPEPFGMGQMVTFEAKINLGAKVYSKNILYLKVQNSGLMIS